MVTGEGPTVEVDAGSSTSLKVMVGWTCSLKRWMAPGLPLVGSLPLGFVEIVVELVEAPLGGPSALWQKALEEVAAVLVRRASLDPGGVGVDYPAVVHTERLP